MAAPPLPPPQAEPMMSSSQGRRRSRPVKGGVRTLPFIIANEVLEKVSTLGLQLIMIIYLTEEYHMDAATASSVLFFWSAVSNSLPMLGAVLADSYVGRFHMIMLTSIVCMLGATMLWLTAFLPGARPPACGRTAEHENYCPPATPGQLTLIYAAFAFVSIGSAGIRPCSLPFGADQFSNMEAESRGKTLQAYFNWYYASVGIAFALASCVIVYVQDNFGWKAGFGLPMGFIGLSAFLFLLGSPLYIKISIRKSIFTEFARVIAAAARKRKLSKEAMVNYHTASSSGHLAAPSNGLRFFNKACVITDADAELGVDGAALDPWRLCTMEEVEDLKSVIRVIPMWSSGIVLSLLMSQNFPVLQAEVMDRHLGGKFQVPAASLSSFQLITLSLWSGCYDQFLLPVIAKITRNPIGLTLKQRMVIGMVFAILGSGVAATVEMVRRKKAIEEGVRISAMWLVAQYVMMGMAEAFNVVAQVEFFYSELPASMSSFAVALWTLGFAVASTLSALIVKVVDAITGRGGRVSWLATDLNKGHFDYYYIILMLLGVGNLVYLLVCAWAYGEVGNRKPWEMEAELQLQEQARAQEEQELPERIP